MQRVIASCDSGKLIEATLTSSDAWKAVESEDSLATANFIKRWTQLLSKCNFFSFSVAPKTMRHILGDLCRTFHIAVSSTMTRKLCNHRMLLLPEKGFFSLYEGMPRALSLCRSQSDRASAKTCNWWTNGCFMFHPYIAACGNCYGSRYEFQFIKINFKGCAYEVRKREPTVSLKAS